MIKVVDNSKNGIYNSNMELVNSFTDYSSKNLDFDKPVTIELMDDEENAKNPLGTTAHYNPDEMKITIYVTGRHIKDILRSISHELIHHVQNCRGDLSGMEDTSLGYAQRDKHMRDMETEAFNSGNIMNFRDFEDNYKQRGHKMNKLRENRLKKLNSILTEDDSLLVEQDLGKKYNRVRNQLTVPQELDLELLADFIVDKSNDKIFSKGELITVYKGIKAAERNGELDKLKKILMKRTVKQTAGFAKGRFLPVYTPDKDYKGDLIKGFKDTFFIGPRDRRRREEIIQILEVPPAGLKKEPEIEAPAAPEAPAQPGEPAVADRECTTVPFSKGCRGPKVGTIKRLIHFTTGMKGDRQKFARNEKFDNETEFMVKEFQKQNGLPETGVVDKETFDKLLDVAVIKRNQQKGQAAQTALAAPAGVSIPTTSTVPSVPPPAATGGAPSVPPAAVPMAGLPKMTRRQAIDTAMNMMRGRDRRFRGTAADLAGRTVYHFMTKGMSPEEAYAKTAEIFGAEGEKVKLGPVSRRNWVRGFLDQLDLIRLSELPELPAE